ncbi:MAG: hypothetical protein DJ555_04235 [Desulfurococcaceae archaeon]|nr:MAG: hypothetical protein DJ555_04235 [Desulfurococcaceae archaeon]
MKTKYGSSSDNPFAFSKDLETLARILCRDKTDPEIASAIDNPTLYGMVPNKRVVIVASDKESITPIMAVISSLCRDR